MNKLRAGPVGSVKRYDVGFAPALDPVTTNQPNAQRKP